MRPTGLRLSARLSPALGSTSISVPSGFSVSRTCVAAPTGSPMSCSASNMVTRSKPEPCVVLRARRLEAHVAEAPACSRAWAIEASWKSMPTNSRVRERLGHDHGRGAVAAADVGHLGAALELGHHAVERRQPLRHEMRLVAGAEEPLDAAEQAVAVIAPADALAGLEGLGELRLVGEDGGERVEAAGHVDGLSSSANTAACSGDSVNCPSRRVVGHEPGGRLRGQPLAHVALVRAGLLGQLGRGQRRAGERAKEPELVADQHQRALAAAPISFTIVPSRGSSFVHVQVHGSDPLDCLSPGRSCCGRRCRRCT